MNYNPWHLGNWYPTCFIVIADLYLQEYKPPWKRTDVFNNESKCGILSIALTEAQETGLYTGGTREQSLCHYLPELFILFLRLTCTTGWIIIQPLHLQYPEWPTVRNDSTESLPWDSILLPLEVRLHCYLGSILSQNFTDSRIHFWRIEGVFLS